MAAARANWRHEAEVLRQGFRVVAGLDEVGVGPWAGPVVAAAVVVRQRRFHVRIDDSKCLTALQRARAYDAICRQADIGVGIISHTIVDRENVLQATRRAMQEAILRLESSPEFLLVDGRLPSLGHLPQRNLVRGERQSLSIACASIIAKVTRDRLMQFYDRLFPQYGFAQHKGYGTRVHVASLRRHGPSPLHRLSYQPVAELLA